MINKLSNYFVVLVTGTIMFSLNGCTSLTTNPGQTNTPPILNESTPKPEETDPPAETISLSFGIYTADKPTAVVKQFRPLLNSLEDNMSEGIGKPVKIKMKVANSYQKGIDDIATGEVDFSRLGPASYIEATTINPDLSILAIESKGGQKTFYGIICVNKNSSINSVQSLQGKSFAFGDQLSTIGRFLSQQYLVNNNIKASSLSRYEYLGRHDKVGTAVGLGQFDAGALKEGTFKKLVNKGVPIKEIAKFPNVEKPWISHNGLPKEVFEQLRTSLIKIRNTDSLETAGIGMFLEGSDLDYATTREAIENNNKFFE